MGGKAARSRVKESGEEAGTDAMRGWERPRPGRSRTVEESQR